MSTAELREKVINQLSSADEVLLKEILALIEIESDSSPYILTEDQKASIDISRKQIKEGHFLTNEEVNKEIEEWLKE